MKTTQQTLREAACFDVAANDRIDRDAGVIRGVKVLGTVSKNGYEYPIEVLRECVTLYEGKNIFVDHTEEDQVRRNRNVDEYIGVMRNLRAEADGLYGDLHYLKTHPMAARLLEAAERFPETLGISPHHDAVLIPAQKRVTRILKVKSLDLVMNPATVAGLFESVQPQEEPAMKVKFKTLLESTRSTSGTARILREMVDADPSLADMEVEPVTEELPAEDALRSAFKAAVMAILDSEASVEEQKAKITALLTAQQEVESAGAGDAEESSEEAPAEGQESENRGLMTRLAKLEAENAGMKAREQVRTLFEQERVSPTDTQLKAAAALPENDRKAFVKELAVTLRESAGGVTPRSGPLAPGEDKSVVYPKVETSKDFARAVR